jgi:hypothetical protein
MQNCQKAFALSLKDPKPLFMKNRNLTALLVLAMIPALYSHGQNDAVELQKLIGKFYDVLSFSDTTTLKLDSLPAFFTRDGKLVAAFGKDITTWTAPEFVGFIRKSIPAQGITSRSEKELFEKTEWFGNIAHVFSTYELTVQAKGQKITRRGINSIQLVKQNDNWNIISLTWDREGDSLKLPSKYLHD